MRKFHGTALEHLMSLNLSYPRVGSHFTPIPTSFLGANGFPTKKAFIAQENRDRSFLQTTSACGFGDYD
ncbi:hypothetical protein OCU04_012416 [Sclerotinia nivalis]|uniref:Uncharacterized protein n=1 Tax=Sclerotinia nivalis TaxID=352851 RepID=A0A9X0DCX3_9HELO|nr:hypothetical protein OCU04_012416 [Sclerotinia nivalis]